MWVGLSSQSWCFTCYYSGNYLIKTKLIRKQSTNQSNVEYFNWLDCTLIIQHDIIIRFWHAVTYRYSSGCTTNVPNGNWQVGEWSWRPWEKSRGRRLSILDIFCLKGNSTYQTSICISTTKDRTCICTLNLISDNHLHYVSFPQHLM